MAQPLQSINLVAPAFKGVNTEDSPLTQDPSFADIADNAVIDKRGRIAARKGYKTITTNKTELGNDRIHKMNYFYDNTGATKLFSVGNNKILSGTDVLVDESQAIVAAGYSISANNWKMVNFNEKAYFFQRGHEPLVYDSTNGLRTFEDVTGSPTSSNLYCHEAIGAYGRLWVTDSGSNRQTIYWSDLLIGTDFSGGSSGSIDVSKVWPDGHDEIRALAAHNNLLIVFGKHSIIVYQGANSPANMSLTDTIGGLGCICRNSIQHIGSDVLFVSNSGLRSFGRVVQEKSMPISDLSISIKTEFIEAIENRVQPTSSIYSPENSFYLITFQEQNITYCFDLKARLESGGYRVTRWPSSIFAAFERTPDGTLYVGSANGVGEYDGYQDNGQPYRFRYYSPGLTFGDPSSLKILKKLRPTVIGANGSTVVLYWSYDLSNNYKSQAYVTGNQVAYYFSDPRDLNVIDPVTNENLKIFQNGLSQFPDPDGTPNPKFAEFTGGVLTSRKVVNATGNGSILTIGMEADIDGFPLSLQEINVLVLMGKTI